ncbi:hypothetical protein CVU75_02620 [Candidatus Dependentiae bacterium HGW-Dependentiae-1]|nr:MAG: hypothetical protein CVU75_02620 [Candidatus Dependentiae bacterium HGW-Dependentiae-1]
MVIKKVALVIAHQGFQPIEYANTKKEIEQAGYHVLTVSDAPGIATAGDGTKANVDCTLDEVKIQNLAGFFLIGGADALEHLDHARTHELLQEANEANLPLGAICISVRILARAYILVDRNATGWDGDNQLDEVLRTYAARGLPSSELEKELQARGAHRVHKDVVVDQNIVTANGPHAATEFGEKIVMLLRERERLNMESKRRY